MPKQATPVPIPKQLHTYRIHFIGIGGSGMAPLAELAARQGFKVSGSDTEDSSTIQLLQTLGIKISIGHSAEAIQGDRVLAVYSSAIKSDNPELVAVKQQQRVLLHRSDFVQYFISQKEHAITVAGTNGKSTTSSILSYILERLGKEPMAIVGARMKDCPSLVFPGSEASTYAVVEADESDGTLLKFKPHVGVLTSIDLDHMDYYRDHQHIFETFKTYISNIKSGGTAVLGIDDLDCLRLSESIHQKKLTYGFSNTAMFQGSDYVCKNGVIYFSANLSGKSWKCRLKGIGKHNASNALASLASLSALDLNMQDAADCLADFSGVKRRLELIFENSNLKIYDDYAHNPTKIQSTIRAVRESWPSSQIIVIFQPHRYSRLKTLYNNFVGSFTNVDLVIALPTYSSGEHDDNPIRSEELVADIVKFSNVPCFFAPNFDSAKDKVAHELKKNSIVLTLGAGDVWQLAFQLKERLG